MGDMHELNRNTNVRFKKYVSSSNTSTSFPSFNETSFFNIRPMERDVNVSYNYNLIDYSEIKKDGYLAQGYTTMGKYALVTGHIKGDTDYARMYVYNVETGEYLGKMILNEKCHAGGITYDPKTGALFVSGNEVATKDNVRDYTNIMVFNSDRIEEIIENNSGDTFEIDLKNQSSAYVDTIQIKGKTLAATIYAKDGRLYTGQFVGNGTGQMYEISYEYSKSNNEIKNVSTVPFSDVAPRLIQGMVVTKKDDKDYYVFAQSIKNGGSSLIVYSKNDEGKLVYEGKKYLSHEGVEGIQIDETGVLSYIFEYDKQNIETMNINDLFKTMSKSQNPFIELSRNIGGGVYDTFDAPK